MLLLWIGLLFCYRVDVFLELCQIILLRNLSCLADWWLLVIRCLLHFLLFSPMWLFSVSWKKIVFFSSILPFRCRWLTSSMFAWLEPNIFWFLSFFQLVQPFVEIPCFRQPWPFTSPVGQLWFSAQASAKSSFSANSGLFCDQKLSVCWFFASILLGILFLS